MTKRLCIWSMLLLSFIVFTAQAQTVDPPKIEIPEKYQQPVTMGVGEEYQIDLQSIFSNDQIPTLAMKSSNSSLFTVSSTGMVKCSGIGTAVISIILKDDAATKVDIQFTGVAIQPTVISVETNQISLEIGGMFKIQAMILPGNATDKTLTYASDNAAVATVSQDGSVFGISPGVCTITIRSVSNPAAICTVTVLVAGGVPVTTMIINPTSASVGIGEDLFVTAIVMPMNATDPNVAYSYDAEIIKITTTISPNTFTITGLKAGNTEIVFKSVSNSSVVGFCKITVVGFCSNSTAPKPKNDTVFVSSSLDDYKKGAKSVQLEVESIPHSHYVWQKFASKTIGTNVLTFDLNYFDSLNTKYTVYRTDTINHCSTEASTIYVVKKECTARPTFVSERYYSLLPDSGYPTFEVKENDAIWLDASYKPIANGSKLSLNEINLESNQYNTFYVIRQKDGCISDPQYVYVQKQSYFVHGYISLPPGGMYEPYIIEVNDGEYRISSDNAGTFVFNAPKAGSYTFSLKTQKNIAIDEKRVIELTTQNYYANISYAAKLTPRKDLAITTYASMAVVGRTMTFGAIVYNYGTKVYNVPVSVAYDSLTMPMVFEGQTIDESKRTIHFTLDSIDTGSEAIFTTILQLSTDWRNQGKVIDFTAKIEKSFDTIPGNDSSLFSTPIRNSCDPNDKAVSPAYGDKGYVLFNQPLEYLIRFQNVGTIDAENIKVVDTLDENLDLSTFEVLAQSHPMTWQMTGRKLTFRFDDIHLLDSTTNEKESHGYVKYRIKPKAQLAENTKVTNTAHIFFDYNPAVVTNTTASEYVSKIPLQKSITTTTALQQHNTLLDMVYPNPTQKTIQLVVSDVVNLQITGIDGQMIKTIANYSGEAIDVSELAAGIYTVTIHGNDETRNYLFTKK